MKWSSYIDEAITLFHDADIYMGVHHWPIWGNQRVMDFLKKQRDVYKYIHDQTVRMANTGMTPREISAELEFPESMRTTFANRGYYGTLSHNAKAVYQFYFGWYDANPANLNPLPPVESGKKYVEFMGGADNVLTKAKNSFDKGEYRWTAEVLSHLVFAHPDNDKARELLARTYDQLGYQAESATWRNAYLMGAFELRHGSLRLGRTGPPAMATGVSAEGGGLSLAVTLVVKEIGIGLVVGLVLWVFVVALSAHGAFFECEVGGYACINLAERLHDIRMSGLLLHSGVEVIDRMINGEKRDESYDLLLELCDTMEDASLCAMGGMTPYPVRSVLRHFAEDFASGGVADE